MEYRMDELERRLGNFERQKRGRARPRRQKMESRAYNQRKWRPNADESSADASDATRTHQKPTPESDATPTKRDHQDEFDDAFIEQEVLPTSPVYQSSPESNTDEPQRTSSPVERRPGPVPPPFLVADDDVSVNVDSGDEANSSETSFLDLTVIQNPSR